MSYQVQESTHRVGDRAFPIWQLENPSSGDRALVFAQLGLNCFRWRCQGRELLYDDDSLFTTGRPTRAGIPILFPFPNRVCAAQYEWEGKTYHLPATDASGLHSIHGFACRKPWRIIDQGADTQQAWLTGEFHASLDAPEALACWPADHRIRVTIFLSEGRLRHECIVDNPGTSSLPFGLGFHPYLALAGFPDQNAETLPVQAPAKAFWELQDNLPTGNRRPVDARRDLNQPKPFGELVLDDLLTALPSHVTGDLRSCGRVGDLRVEASPDFRELVVFTPPHRQAICLEPYTCVTDAINLQARGIDAGLLVLRPKEQWSGRVEFILD